MPSRGKSVGVGELTLTKIKREKPEAHELALESEDDGESEAESFLTDDELAYQEGLDPFEDAYYFPDEEHSTSAAEEQDNSPDNGQTQPRTRRKYRSTNAGSVSRDRGRTRSRSPHRPLPVASTTSWKTEQDSDPGPVQKRFSPARPPGHQLNSNCTYKPLDLFKLFISNDTALTICSNSNKKAAKHIAKGKKYSWTDINIQEFYKYVGLTFFFALVKLNNIQEYWKKNTIFSVPFPANIMPRDRYRIISWNIHLSDPEKDIENDKKKGTPDYDSLFRLRPLLDTIRDASKAFYHPRQNVSVNERTVVAKARTGLTQCVKTRSSFKLFALTDISNGYTVDFAVYTGKSHFPSGTGLAYDSVMSLIKPAYLGTGFDLYVGNFYANPKLFKDLFDMKIGACGAYRDRRKDCSRFHSKDPIGSIKWIRDDPLLFVKWMDRREVTVCSTIHRAFCGITVERRIKSQDGSWTTKAIPCPTPVFEYNKRMGGIDLSEQCIQHYSIHNKSVRWYRTLFFHFLDIAATNSYLLHKELCREKQEEPLTHRAFLEELTAQLCGVTVSVPYAKEQRGHVPVAISFQSDKSRKASYGRKTCLHCRKTRQVRLSTPWKCKQCDVALCLIADRNCFEAWHS